MDSISSWKIFLLNGLTVAYGGSMLLLHKPWTAFRKRMVDTTSQERQEPSQDANSDTSKTNVVTTNISGIDHQETQAQKSQAANCLREILLADGKTIWVLDVLQIFSIVPERSEKNRECKSLHEEQRPEKQRQLTKGDEEEKKRKTLEKKHRREQKMQKRTKRREIQEMMWGWILKTTWEDKRTDRHKAIRKGFKYVSLSVEERYRLWEVEGKVSRMIKEVVNRTKTGTTNQEELLAGFRMAILDTMRMKNLSREYAMQWFLYDEGPGDYSYSDDECDDLLMI